MRLVYAELLKLRTTRTVVALVGAMVVVVAFAAGLHAGALSAENLVTHADQMKVFGWGELAALFASLLGALAVTSELRHGTIRPTLLVAPNRARVLGAKAVAASAVSVALGPVAAGVALAVGTGVLHGRGIGVQLSGGDIAQLALGSAAAALLWAPIGVAVGALVRSQVAAVAGLCIWFLFVENLLLGQLPGTGRYFPGAAAAAIGGASITGQTAPTLLAAAAGALLLAVYAAVSFTGAATAMVRRDVG